VYIYINTVC